MRAHQVGSYGPTVNADDPSPDGTGGTPAAVHDGSPQYEIRVEGRLGSRWSAWFDGMTLVSEGGGITAIRGPVVDQAALHGLLQKLRDVGIPLVSLTRLFDPAPTEPPALQPSEGN